MIFGTQNFRGVNSSNLPYYLRAFLPLGSWIRVKSTVKNIKVAQQESGKVSVVNSPYYFKAKNNSQVFSFEKA